ncbi:serine-rich adhesin for platelets-like [Ylistrum balloti]|uniref:serine-rich adhesin for platelets-like n=1 Tax=Ylistrum balloti TaxID=509963 RepID=UPI00290584BB|nr:serine-rich adhesin for platelets-like [Ylistrum balloti]
MLLLCIFVLFLGLSTVQGQGRVYIGYAGSSVVPVLRFSSNDATLTVPVYLQVMNATDVAAVESLNPNVVVSCELSYPVEGYSRASFVDVTVGNTNTNSTVNFNINNPGRTLDVRCFGVSNNGLFTKTGSISSPVPFTIVTAPKVSICTDGGVVVQNLPRTTKQSFLVGFSEATLGPVDIICIVAGSGTTQLNISTVTSSANENRTTVTYSLNNAGTPVTVRCSGQSQGGTRQYLHSTSAGDFVQFTMNSPQLRIYPRYMESTSPSFNMLVVVESAPDSGVPLLSCQASVFNNTQQVAEAINQTNLAGNCPIATTTTTTTSLLHFTASPSTTTASTDVSGPAWGALITKTNLVNVTRRTGVTSAVTEYVVVTCCSTSGTPILSDAVFVEVNLTPNVTLDWSKATAQSAVNAGRKYQNPAYVDVAPCPCDLTFDLCDINCCCDTNCTDAMKSSFSFCVPGLAGGETAPVPEYDCDSTHPLKDDWFPLMCVYREYNALLGYFYANSLSVRSSQSFQEKISGEEFYSYKEEESRTSATLSTAYKSGTTVTVSQDGTSQEYTVPLVLPHRVLSGQCTLASPVQYLVDDNTDCLIDLNEASCSVDGSFNALFYVESSSTRSPSCPKPFVVRGNNGLESTTIAVTSVNYHCTTDFTGYIKDNTVTSPTRPTNTTTFNYTMPSLADQDECGNDITTDFNTIATSTSDETTLPPRCSFDNGYQRPPVPSFDNANSLCSNTVLEVRYKFLWSGSQILQLNATVIMGNVPVGSVITQKFSTEFIHSFSGNISQDDYLGLGTSFERSGWPGYDKGKPLFTGSAMTLNDGAFYVNQNTSRQHALWSTDVNGLCYNAGRRPIMFGEDSFTSCDIYLTAADLYGDCEDLRKLLINRLNNLMAADRIGRFGNNNPYDSSHWVTVQRGNLSYVCERPVNLTDADVIARESSGMCTDVVTGINLEIMYAETGKSDYQPIYEVIGAFISYTNITLNLTCGTSGDPACQGIGVQAFPIHSTVNFVKVSAQTPPRIDRWQEFYDASICSKDTCWEELIYPLSSAYDGSKQFALAMVLLLILFIIGYLMLVRPWWSINI